VNLSFSVPDFERAGDYQELCSILLKTLIQPKPSPRLDESLDPDSSEEEAEEEEPEVFTSEEEDLPSISGNTRPVSKPHRFLKLEILGDKVKKLSAMTGPTSDFFFTLLREGCANVHELILDAIFRKPHLSDMVRGLFSVLQPPSKPPGVTSDALHHNQTIA
jgi:hypothetical protein